MKFTKTAMFAALIAASASTQVLAENNGLNLYDITNGDSFYYTSDQDVKDDDGQKESVGVGRPSTTHSGIPHLPVYHGYMNTNYTYRFVNVAEQVFTMIGEGKHGLWRVGENGMIREYLKKGAKGVQPGADLSSKKNRKRIAEDYSSFIPEESWSGYKYPDQKLSDAGALNYIDLPISHPKYKGKYDDHVPVDLASFNCTMSGPEYPYSKEIMNFAFNQPAAGVVGPLGKRAGLDIDENYTKILQLDHFEDANSWVNVGVEGKDSTYFQYAAIDKEKTQAEYYLVERPFFNVPYLFIIAVYDNVDNDDFSYVRPDGPYWDSLSKKEKKSVRTEVVYDQRFHTKDAGLATAERLPVYGLHHPNRDAFGSGGACPGAGGDWGRYPNGADTGAMWPTNYEEVTPYCDAVVADIKFTANLDGKTWDDAAKYLANAGVGTKTREYKMQAGDYGVYSEAYNVDRGIKNPHQVKAPRSVTMTYPSVQKAVSYNETPKEGKVHSFYDAHPESKACRQIGTVPE